MKKVLFFEAVILITASIYVLNVLYTVEGKHIREDHDVYEQIKMEMLIQ